MAKLESKVVRMVRQIALENNFKPYFVQPVAGSEGVPDCILKTPLGGTLHLEIKSGSKLRKAQKVFLAISNNAWECKYNSKTKQVEVILDQDDREAIELDLFLAHEAQAEISLQEYKASMVEEYIAQMEQHTNESLADYREE